MNLVLYCSEARTYSKEVPRISWTRPKRLWKFPVGWSTWLPQRCWHTPPAPRLSEAGPVRSLMCVELCPTALILMCLLAGADGPGTCLVGIPNLHWRRIFMCRSPLLLDCFHYMIVTHFKIWVLDWIENLQIKRSMILPHMGGGSRIERSQKKGIEDQI